MHSYTPRMSLVLYGKPGDSKTASMLTCRAQCANYSLNASISMH